MNKGATRAALCLVIIPVLIAGCAGGSRSKKPAELASTKANKRANSAEIKAGRTVAPAPTSAPQPADTPPAASSPAPAGMEAIATPAAGQHPAFSVSIDLGAPQQILQPGQLGLEGVPDQPLTPMQQPDGSYRLFVVGGSIGGTRGATGLVSTKDFHTYAAAVGDAQGAKPVLSPSCRAATSAAACADNYDANYAGADLVFPASNDKDLLMLYQGVSKDFGGTSTDNAFYSVVGLATSQDNGTSWTPKGAVITGSDPKPTSNPRPGAIGADQSGAIVADGYVYDFFPYFPSNDSAGPTIQAARAPLSGDAAPGTWTKYYAGSFGSQPGLGGLGSQVVPTASACTRPAQPWLARSTYLNEYVMVFICKEGWFYSLSQDLANWSTPKQFFTAPAPLFTHGQEADENLSLVTPGNAGQVIGQTGYVLYARTLAWGQDAHELWMRPFTFSMNP